LNEKVSILNKRELLFDIMRINKDKCYQCGECLSYCPLKAIIKVENTEDIDWDEDNVSFEIDEDICNNCGECLHVCPVNECLEI